VLDEGELRKLLSGRRKRRPLPVTLLDSHLCAVLRCDKRLIYLTWETILKQRRRHKEVTVGDYLLLPHVIERGLAVLDDRRHILIAGYEPEPINPRLFRAVIKTDWLFDGLFVQSFHELEIAKLRRLRRWKIVREFR
jgi:hypothetical protein